MRGPIVCGVDGSISSRDAVRVAGELADRFGSRLIAAHVAQLPAAAGYDVMGRGHWGTDLAAANEAGLGLLQQVVGETARRDTEQRLMTGVPAEQLAELADQQGAALIVVGSRARRPFKAAFLGSVSHDVIGLARCPVVVVPPGLSEWDDDR